MLKTYTKPLFNKSIFQGFPGGPVVTDPPANAGDTGSILVLGRRRRGLHPCSGKKETRAPSLFWEGGDAGSILVLGRRHGLHPCSGKEETWAPSLFWEGGDAGSILVLGRRHRFHPCSGKIPQAAGQLSLHRNCWVHAPEPVLQNKRNHRNEKPSHHSQSSNKDPAQPKINN